MGLFARHPSFEARLSGLVALAVGVAVALAALAAYLLVDHDLHAQVQKSLVSYERSVNGPVDFGAAAHFATNNGDRLQFVLSDGQVYLWSDDGGGLVPAATGMPVIPLTTKERTMANGNGPNILFSDQRVGNQTYRVMTLPATLVNVGSGVLQIGRSLSDVDRVLADLRLILVLVTAGGVAVALAIGTAVARTTLRPVERLRAAAEHVAATQSLDATIEPEGEDELGRLAHAFNAMLAALRVSRQQQAQLVSDAGHELRTPLTSLRTNIELLMRAGDLPEADRRELLDDVRDQLEELTALVGDIVETARQDEHAHVETTEARLDTIVERAVDRVRRRAPSLDFRVSLTPGSVRAQPALLERAVLNVLDNAAKWSPPGGTVEVTLTRRGTWGLEVRDHGPGIAAEDLPKVFDRFYRAASARSMPGSGLGLAIVQDAIADHGGTVVAIRPDGGGTLVRITLPVVEEDEPALPDEAAALISVPPPPPGRS